MTKPENVCVVSATLGEGPVWIDDRLWFVDILACRIHCFGPESLQLQSWTAPSPVGWILPAQGGRMIVGLRDGLHLFDPRSGAFTPYLRLTEEPAGNRLNDACADSRGRLWFGTMDYDCLQPTGLLYRHDAGDVIDTGLAAVPVTNGPALSRDATTLYAVDTMAGLVTAYTVAADGSLLAPRAFARIDAADGLPDGAIVDAEDCVWIALFGGWAVRRYDPDGKLMATVPLPCANVTKIAFGGEGLRTAFATTARFGLSPSALGDQPAAGDIFAFDAGVAGLACPRVTLADGGGGDD